MMMMMIIIIIIIYLFKGLLNIIIIIIIIILERGKKFPAFYETRMFKAVFTRSCQLSLPKVDKPSARDGIL